MICMAHDGLRGAAITHSGFAVTGVLLQIGWTPLHLAIEHKQDGMVELLLKLGADPETPNKVIGISSSIGKQQQRQ